MKVLSLNHRTADVALRERYALPVGSRPELLRALAGIDGVDELTVVSTCNRVEIMWQGEAAPESLRQRWSELLRQPTLSESHLDYAEGIAAIEHLMRVCAGIDSMVLGEPQILGQVKEGLAAARAAGTVGRHLSLHFDKALQAAKRVRSETDVGKNAVSISYYAVKVAEQIFDPLTECTVLVMGAGEMAELALRHFKEHDVRRVLLWNRTEATACHLASELGVTAIPTASLAQHLTESDVVLVSTGARDYILRAADIEQAQAQRRNRPMLILDISVPRNADPAVRELPNVYLYDMDTLRTMCEDNAQKRQAAVQQAEAIIAEQAAKVHSRASRDIEPTLAALYNHWNELAQAELERTARKQNWSEADQQAAQQMLQSLGRKLLHPAQQALKQDRIDAQTVTDILGLRAPQEPPL